MGGGGDGSRIVQSVLDLGTAAAMEGMQEGAEGGVGKGEAASVADHAMEEQEEQEEQENVRILAPCIVSSMLSAWAVGVGRAAKRCIS